MQTLYRVIKSRIKSLFIAHWVLIGLVGCGGGGGSTNSLLDTIPPVITLLGNNPLNLVVGENFVDPSASALDDVDGDLTSAIQSNTNINNTVAGSYSITYSVSDKAGNNTIVSRTVIVNETEIIYEDAEEGSIEDWSIFDNDPIGASISNVFDSELGSRVIEFFGDGTRNGYELREQLSDGSFVDWDNTSNTIIEWKMKYSENFKVIVKVDTINGVRYLTYANYPGSSTSSKIWYNISDEHITGSWQTISRNVSADIQSRQLNNKLTQIDAIQIKGSGRVDDIKTSGSYEDPIIFLNGSSRVNINLGEAFIDSGATAYDSVDGDLTTSIVSTSTVNINVGGSYTVSYSVTDSSGKSASISRIVDVFDPAADTVYEDAEDGSIGGWTIKDSDPGGATISNMFDTDKNSFVISLNGTSLDNQFHLRNADLTDWNNRTNESIQWSMKFSEPFEVEVQVLTLMGVRNIIYNDAVVDQSGSGTNIYYGLTSAASDGTWQTFTRNLSQDLETAQSGNKLISIMGFSVRGSGSFDDIITKGLHTYTPLTRTGYIKRSNQDAQNLGDLEAIRYVGSDNSLVIGDDDGHLVYSLDLTTETVAEIKNDDQFGEYTQANPNPDSLDLNCNFNENTGETLGFCDPEAIAYDPVNDEMFIFTGNHPGELATFKLGRANTNDNFSVTGWKRVFLEYTSAIVINNQFYVSIVDPLTGNAQLVSYDWETDTIGSPVFTTAYKIEDTAFDNGVLWILTAPDMLYKIRFSDMEILGSFDMRTYRINDPRGVEVVNGILYIGDGYDFRTDDLKHAIHKFVIP